MNRQGWWLAFATAGLVAACGKAEPVGETAAAARAPLAVATAAAPTAADDAAALKRLAAEAYDHAGSGGEPPTALYPYLTAPLVAASKACMALQEKKNAGRTATPKLEGYCLDGPGSIVHEGAGDWDKMYASRKFEVAAVEGHTARIHVMMQDAGDAKPSVAFVLLAVREQGAWKIDDILTAGNAELSARAMLKASMVELGKF